MKRILLFILIVIATATSFNAQTAPDAGKLTRLLNEFLAGAGRNDAAIHDRFWADDVIYTRSIGVRENKKQLMAGLKHPTERKPGDPVTMYTAEDIQIHQYGMTAVVAFTLLATTTKTDGTKSVAFYLNTGTFIKRKGRWQAVAWQATAVPKT